MGKALKRPSKTRTKSDNAVLDAPILIAEGLHEDSFFKALARARGLPAFNIPNREKGEPTGNGSFTSRLTALHIASAPEFVNAAYVLVVADNAACPERLFSQIAGDIVRSRCWSKPNGPRERVESTEGLPPLYLLMLPWDDDKGCLETLCYTAAASNYPVAADCVTKYIRCASLSVRPIEKLDKIRIRCLISAICEDDPNTTLQYAWSGDCPDMIPLDHHCFDKIVAWIKTLPT